MTAAAAGSPRDRLLQAIKDCDQEVLGDRDPNEVLTNYVVLYAHRRVDSDPDNDSDALARLTMPGQSVWQTLGLVNAGGIYLRHQMLGEDDES